MENRLMQWRTRKYLSVLILILILSLNLCACAGHRENKLLSVEQMTADSTSEAVIETDLADSDPSDVLVEIIIPENDPFINPPAVTEPSSGTDGTTNEMLLPPFEDPDSDTEASSGSPGLRVHFIDVGQADAALIECDGEYMLIDAGNEADGAFLSAYLLKQKITSLSCLLITHGHEDHYGGAASILKLATADRILCSTTSVNASAFFDLNKYAYLQGRTIEVPETGDVFELGGATVQILSCNAGEEINDQSIVTKISYSSTSFLMTGDAERAAEEFLLDSGSDLSSTVLKVGHHGANNASTYPFLRDVMPEYAVISVGKDNEYGHPTDGALSRLKDCGAVCYRTDMHGTVIMESDGETITVSTEKTADTDPYAVSTLYSDPSEVTVKEVLDKADTAMKVIGFFVK